MPARKPDAFLLPAHFGDVNGSPARPGKIGLAINDALGGVAQLGQDIRSGMTFARVDPHQTRLYPYGHPAEGQERYEWFVAEKQGADWVPVFPVKGHPAESGKPLVGYLKGDPHVVDPAVLEAAYQAKKAEYLASPQWAEQLRKLDTVGSTGDDHAI